MQNDSSGSGAKTRFEAARSASGGKRLALYMHAVIYYIRPFYVPLLVQNVKHKPNLIAVSIYDEYSVGPSIRPVWTKYSFKMTNVIQACSNFN